MLVSVGGVAERVEVVGVDESLAIGAHVELVEGVDEASHEHGAKGEPAHEQHAQAERGEHEHTSAADKHHVPGEVLGRPQAARVEVGARGRHHEAVLVRIAVVTAGEEGVHFADQVLLERIGGRVLAAPEQQQVERGQLRQLLGLVGAHQTHQRLRQLVADQPVDEHQRHHRH